MAETAVTDLDLPPGVRLDPRRGRCGGQYVLVACPVCGREARYLLSRYLAQMRHGRPPRTCSIECSGIMRRQSQVASCDLVQEPVDEIVDEGLPPGCGWMHTADLEEVGT